MSIRTPAEVFHPGEFLKDELEARNWTQVEFAEIIGKDARLVNEVMSGKRAVTPETAIVFSEALGTTPDLWLRLEAQYQLSKVKSSDSVVAKKAELHSNFPVREMIKRGWIEGSKNIEVLQAQVCSFFNVKSVSDQPSLAYAAKSACVGTTPIAQSAWYYRARNIAQSAPASKFDAAKLDELVVALREKLAHPEATQYAPAILANAGIRFVVVEALPGSKIDGACFWLNKTSPVVAMSMRFDRIDNFWHTLFHEIDHVSHKEGMDAPILDVDIQSTDIPQIDEKERRANEVAASRLVDPEELEGFIARVSPIFTDDQILGFARRIGSHPGLVVGQLQNRGLIPWSYHRKHLAKVREIVVANALTDGFGRRALESQSI
jgi:HTH-type transcriptional regulator / antitoxin HigA